MARTYAGILGTLAMAVVICRGCLQASGVQGTLTTAIFSLILFALVGAILGRIAQSTIDESVQSQLQQQLTQHAGSTSGFPA